MPAPVNSDVRSPHGNPRPSDGSGNYHCYFDNVNHEYYSVDVFDLTKKKPSRAVASCRYSYNLSDQSFLSAWSTVKYLQKRQYWFSGSPVGIDFCSMFRLPMVLGYWVTILVFLAGVIVSIINGWPPSWS